jgi:hypothetical protein
VRWSWIRTTRLLGISVFYTDGEKTGKPQKAGDLSMRSN